MNPLPLRIPSGVWKSGHCQGICADARRRRACFSFTTAFVVRDFSGNLIGSVEGLRGHLGSIALSPLDGRVYASLEYKNDAIGAGIQKMLGAPAEAREGFYAAIFDIDKITRPGMKPADEGVMTAVFLQKPLADYLFAPDGAPAHRYGASGIDGLCFGPMFGSSASAKPYLFVAYGVYSDANREDNNYQILLKYDVTDWKALEKPLSPGNMHESGPRFPDDVLFAYTGNTTYGVQCLTYDAWARRWLMAVYRGKKKRFPNYPMFALDAAAAPVEAPLEGIPGETGKCLRLMNAGLIHAPTGIRGYEFPFGQTGMCAMGGGLYYVSEDAKVEGGWTSEAVLYRHDDGRFLVPASIEDANLHE